MVLFGLFDVLEGIFLCGFWDKLGRTCIYTTVTFEQENVNHGNSV